MVIGLLVLVVVLFLFIVWAYLLVAEDGFMLLGVAVAMAVIIVTMINIEQITVRSTLVQDGKVGVRAGDSGSVEYYLIDSTMANTWERLN